VIDKSRTFRPLDREGMVECPGTHYVLVILGQSHVVLLELRVLLQRLTLNGLEIS